MIGTTLRHYRIAGRLGAGGMGEVYRATDTKLGRDVALKILPREMSSDPERLKWFRREARTVAALNHPHIVTIFSVEDDAGVHFLTMELVEGRALDEILTRGRLSRERFFEIGIPFADAVAAAHARGIVHRDLKPANLMLDAEGRLKVLDFGIAKTAPAAAAGAETRSLSTMPGQVVGTAPYMSPEQASGRPVDERSDVFSLGAVLYELATGVRPFDGDSLPAILFAVVSHEPRPVSETRPDLPGVDTLLAQCLIKDAGDRRITSALVRDRLRALQRESQALEPLTPEPVGGSAVPRSAPEQNGRAFTPAKGARPRRPIIAVLPFRSATADPELESFATSLGNDVVDGVTSTSQAAVLPGSATQRFGDEQVDARHVGRELGAGYVVQGAVRRGGSRLRVTAQLVSVETGAQIWSRHYDRDLDQADLFDVGDEIRAQIVSAVSDVHGVIFEVERQRLEGRSVEELDPWECIFVTLGYDKFIDVEHHRLANAALERAVALDPGFALAWGYRSWIATDEIVYGFNLRPDPMPRAMAAARRGVELDPYSHMLRWLLSRVHFFEGNIEGFLSEGNKALELNANDATVIGLIGLYSSLSGHWERGDQLMRRAMALNPSYPSYYHMALGLDCFRQGHYEEALAEFRRLTFTGNPFAQGMLAAILAHLGRIDEAGPVLRELRAQMPDPTPEAIRVMYGRWNVRGQLLEALMDGLGKAGLPGHA